MGDLMETNPDNSSVCIPLVEIFHHDEVRKILLSYILRFDEIELQGRPCLKIEIILCH